METMVENTFLANELLGNSVLFYILSLLSFLLISIAFKFFRDKVLKKLKKLAESTATEYDSVAVSVFESIRPIFYYYLAFYLSLQLLVLASLLDRVLDAVLVVLLIYHAVLGAQIFVDFFTEKAIGKQDDAGTITAFKNIAKIVKIILWSFGLLLVLSNLGVEVTALVAGLGVGGVAIAFALQAILSDLFSSFAIFFDKPFVPGDFIVVGESSGVVEKIGIKTTRMRSLSGEEIVVSNQHLTSATVHNYRRLTERRVLFTLGLIYETDNKDMKKALKLIKKIIDDDEMTRLDRVNFVNFGDFSLDIEISYYVLSTDFYQYLDVKERINLTIKSKLEKANINIAYPTQKLFVSKD